MPRQSGTAGQLIVNEILPPDMRRQGIVLDKKGVSKLLSELAKKHPDKYRDISFKLGKIGREVAYASGGNSFGLKHLLRAQSAIKRRQELSVKLSQLLDDDNLSEKQRDDAVVKLMGGLMEKQQDEIFDESFNEKNPLAMQLLGAGRGNKMNLASLRGSDGLYQDHRARVIPIPVLRSYSQGLSPLEYWAGTYGARQGVLATKFATQDAGYFGKQLNQISHRLMVTGNDSDKDPDTIVGLPVDIEDDDSEGALLAHPVGNYKRNTVLTPKILSDLRKQNIKRILVRSPAVSGSPDGGVYARDVGVREFNRLPVTGENPGLAAAQALCLAGDTLVRMADGSDKAIKDIKRGELVIGCSREGVMRPVRVLDVYSNGKKPCINYSFRRGTGGVSAENMLSVCCTKEHKILSETVFRSGYRKNTSHIDILPIGTVPAPHDRFCARLGDSFDDTGLKQEPLARLIGCLIGDGCYTGNIAQLALSCYDPEQMADLEDELMPLGISFSAMSTGEYRVVDDTARQPKFRADGTYYRHRVKEWLKVRKMYGQHSGNKTLPPDVFTWDNKSVANLISGFIAADGWISSTGYVGFGSNSTVLLRQLKLLLSQRFGINTSSLASSVKSKGDGTYYAPNYRFVICSKADVRKLAQVANIPGVKQKRLALAVKNQDTTSGNYSSRCLRTGSEYVGVLDTYDLHVDHPDHLFVLANGLVVSNSEPISQAQLSTKHSGGVAGAAKVISGFDYINQLVQVPKTFKGGAAHAEKDGTVDSVEPSPAGGFNVIIDGTPHYVGTGYEVSVKPGDKIEAGDIISDGEPNPYLITKHKGIGEGRRYFIKAFVNAMKSSGAKSNRRNVELLSRGLINHVRLNDEYGDYAPDDVVPYSVLEHGYQPREGSIAVIPKAAVGKYLERPYLHYTIGTRVKPSMLKDFDEFGINNIQVHNDPAPFEPEMVRGMANLHHDPDFMTRMFGSGLKGSLLDAVHRGGSSDEAGTSFVASRARAVDFGRVGLVKAPKTPTMPKILP